MQSLPLFSVFFHTAARLLSFSFSLKCRSELITSVQYLQLRSPSLPTSHCSKPCIFVYGSLHMCPARVMPVSLPFWSSLVPAPSWRHQLLPARPGHPEQPSGLHEVTACEGRGCRSLGRGLQGPHPCELYGEQCWPGGDVVCGSPASSPPGLLPPGLWGSHCSSARAGGRDQPWRSIVRAAVSGQLCFPASDMHGG